MGKVDLAPIVVKFGTQYEVEFGLHNLRKRWAAIEENKRRSKNHKNGIGFSYIHNSSTEVGCYCLRGLGVQ